MTSRLALHGGTPVVPFEHQTFTHPQVDPKILVRAGERSLRERLVSFTGLGLVDEVEDTFRRTLDVGHTLATNSGTSALFAMYYAMGLGPGDEVLVPAYTFFASAMPLFRLGCQPILVDCLDNGNIDPADIARKATAATKAIAITHMWGIPCEMAEITEVASKLGLPILEDASHAHGATYDGAPVGAIGAAGAWSLGAQKIVTGGQGGMLQSRDRDVYERAFLVSRANDKINDRGITATYHHPYAVTGCGLNLRMHPFAALTITAQLARLPQQLAQRRETAQFLMDELKDVPGMSFPRIPEGAEPAWYAFPVSYDTAAMRDVSRAAFVEAVVAEGATGVDIPGSTCPLAEFPCFRGEPGTFAAAPVSAVMHAHGDFPQAERFHATMIKFPVWYGENRLDYARSYVNAVTKVLDNLDELASAAV